MNVRAKANNNYYLLSTGKKLVLMLYYSIVMVTVVLFGLQFLFSGKYQEEMGNSLFSTLLFSFSTSAIGSIFMFILNGFSLVVNWFTFIVALFAAINSILCSLFSLKALSIMNLSLYSVFSMIGGMALPFIVGIVFYNEALTITKIICFVLIVIAVLITFDFRKKESKKSLVFGFGIFITNGMSGVISMYFNNADISKSSPTNYSLCCALFMFLLSGIVLLVMKKENKLNIKIHFNVLLVVSILLCGILSYFANYLLLLSLKHIPGSLQYPLVTGGVMVVSTIIGCFTKNKPQKKDVFSVLVAFLAMTSLLLPF